MIFCFVIVEEYYFCNVFLDLVLCGFGEFFFCVYILYFGFVFVNVIVCGVYFEVIFRVWFRWRMLNFSGVDLVCFVFVIWEFYFGYMCI